MVELAEGQMAGDIGPGGHLNAARQGSGAGPEGAGPSPECFNRGMALTTLAHHIDAVWMGEAYRRVRKEAVAGVDGMTAAHYEVDREANLSSLLERFESRQVGQQPVAEGAVRTCRACWNGSSPVGIGRRRCAGCGCTWPSRGRRRRARLGYRRGRTRCYSAWC